MVSCTAHLRKTSNLDLFSPVSFNTLTLWYKNNEHIKKVEFSSGPSAAAAALALSGKLVLRRPQRRRGGASAAGKTSAPAALAQPLRRKEIRRYSSINILGSLRRAYAKQNSTFFIGDRNTVWMVIQFNKESVFHDNFKLTWKHSQIRELSL